MLALVLASLVKTRLKGQRLEEQVSPTVTSLHISEIKVFLTLSSDQYLVSLNIVSTSLSTEFVRINKSITND